MPLRNPYAAIGVDAPAPQFSALQLPAYLAWAGVGFLRCWRQTRHVGYILQGLPALLLVAVLAILFWSRDQPVASQTIESYLARAENAMHLEDYEQAEFYFRKLKELAPTDRKVIHEHALLHARQGDYFEAFRMMETLVSDDDRSNDVKVHLWLAKTALEQDVDIEEPLEFARRHLVAVLEADPNEVYAHYFFAVLHMRQRETANAIEHLRPIAVYSAELQVLLASLYMQLDPPDVARAQALARTVSDSISRTIESTQTSDVSIYHQLSGAYVILGEYEKAIQTLRQAAVKFDLEATRRQLSRVYVAWADDVRNRRPDDMAERIRLLERALQSAPNEPLALHRMLEIASSEGEGAESAEQALRQALVEGVAPAAVHFSLGTLAAKRGDIETAMRHFKLSSQLNPRTAVVLNNMAFVMIQTPDADLDQALMLINQAIDIEPGAAPFRDTRGQILIKMNRAREAIGDLEFANANSKDLASRIATCKSLVVAYRDSGDVVTADAYQKEYDRLIAQANVEKSNDTTDSVTPDVEFDNAPKPLDDQPAEPPADDAATPAE